VSAKLTVCITKELPVRDWYLWWPRSALSVRYYKELSAADSTITSYVLLVQWTRLRVCELATQQRGLQYRLLLNITLHFNIAVFVLVLVIVLQVRRERLRLKHWLHLR